MDLSHLYQFLFLGLIDFQDLLNFSFHPFSIVKEPAFKKFAGWIPGYKPPTRKTLSGSLLQECYVKSEQIIRSQVVKEVENICITTDLWTSGVTESYFALTGQYLTENLVFKTFLLGCCLIFKYRKTEWHIVIMYIYGFTIYSAEQNKKLRSWLLL
ncbi:unnamed protein product [Diabrotica balteata]|uniref:Uncharacterized protein n=1 Tax=Diabrotica balteata TaxID=107213 RepID=A0A9N9TA95_DIABA|nr:unnamed protein product [Diabrotica balteata]